MRIIVLCEANYCRSPVAENFLQSFVGNKVEVLSRGVNDYYKIGMNPLSHSYLISKGITPKLHKPKVVSKIDINHATKILCMDYRLITVLSSRFGKDKKKFQLFSKKDIADPINYDQSHYLEVMQEIERASLEISNKLLEKI